MLSRRRHVFLAPFAAVVLYARSFSSVSTASSCNMIAKVCLVVVDIPSGLDNLLVLKTKENIRYIYLGVIDDSG